MISIIITVDQYLNQYTAMTSKIMLKQIDVGKHVAGCKFLESVIYRYQPSIHIIHVDPINLHITWE